LHPTHRQTPQRLSFLDNPAPGAEVKNLYLGTTLGAVDILGSIQGVGDYARVRESSVEMVATFMRCRSMAAIAWSASSIARRTI
jgi:hypothetical protein